MNQHGYELKYSNNGHEILVKIPGDTNLTDLQESLANFLLAAGCHPALITQLFGQEDE